MIHEETYMQKMVVNYVRHKYPDLLVTCAPACAATARQGINNKLMGYQKGWPDLFFARARKNFNGLAIELKTQKGTLNEFQKLVLQRLNDEGYKAVVCRSADEAISIIESYLKG